MKRVTKAIFLILALILPVTEAWAVVYQGASTGLNGGLPTNGAAGNLVIAKPAGTVVGEVMLASISARPTALTVVAPTGWILYRRTEQTNGGVSTAPGGMSLFTYYKEVTAADASITSYTWTLANSTLGQGGGAAGVISRISGVDTLNPIDVYADVLSASGRTHTAPQVTTTTPNTILVAGITYLSACPFNPPTGTAGFVRKAQVQAPASNNQIGLTLQVSAVGQAAAGLTGTVSATAPTTPCSGYDDNGIGHMFALSSPRSDLSLDMVRSGPLVPGAGASYTLTVSNLSPSTSEAGTVTVVNTLPAGLTYNPTGSGGTGWTCGAAGQVVTCTRSGLAAGATAPALLLNVNVAAGTSGLKTNTATVTGTGGLNGDGNRANNTDSDSYTLATDLAITMVSSTLNPGQSGTYTIGVSNGGTMADSGPVTVTDTLPAGLTYVSGSGTGWSCSAAGQAVTCTRAGALAAGASAGTLTLNVDVSQTAVAFTNAASVAGTTTDGNMANNSASVAYSATADLSLTMTRGSNLVPGTNAAYTLNVMNSGPNDAPQPITISDTLPAGLTYVSGVGAGWSCSAAGQVITCTRTGTLANGAASSLVLTVAVSAGASGTVTHTATVSGTATDGNAANNTASDSYTIPLSTYAYYKMDEASWNGTVGEVVNSSGAGPNATSQGSAATESASASGLKGDTCRAGVIPSTAGSGVSTGIEIDGDLGSAGTISFWYKSNTAWNDGNDRILFDASNNLGNGNADKHFYLVKGDGGELRFALEDSQDDNENLSSGGLNYPAGEWHHIAVTWDWVSSRRMYLYLDGVSVGNNEINDSIGNYSTLLLGMAKGGVSGADTDYTANTANGVIDEVRIYNRALTAAQVAADKNASHGCAIAAPNHLRIEHDGGAISCHAEPVVVKACANADCSTLYTSGVTGVLTAGVNEVAFSIPNGQSQATVSIHLPSSTAVADPQSARLGTDAVSPTPTDADSPYCSNSGGALNNTTACDMSVYKAGFIFDVPNLVSGTVFDSVNVSAVRSSDGSTCVPLFQNVTRDVAFWGDYQNPVTGTLPLQINGSDIETTSTPAYTSTYSLEFNNSGVATLTSVQYNDVGLMQLNARYVGDVANTPPDGGMIVTGSDTFVVKPAYFELSGIQQTAAPNLANPAAADATESKFVMAGEEFTVVVSAKNALDELTPNYGKETVRESVMLTAVVEPGLGMPHALTTVGGAFSYFGLDCTGGAGTAGMACGTDFTWNEVGIIKLTPSVGDGDYLGAGDVAGTQSGNIGRFYPASFALAGGVIANRTDLAGCAVAGCGTFTYMGEQLNALFTLTALAVDGTTVTQNYNYSATAANNFAKLDPLAAVTAGTGGPLGLGAVDSAAVRTPFPPCGGTPAHPCVTPGQATAGVFSQGIADVSVPLTIFRDAAAAAGPFSALDIGVAPVDGDGVTVAYNLDTTNVVAGALDHALVGRADVRYGRMKISNAHGSELLNLPITVTAQFWNGASYVTNVLDNNSSFPAILGVAGVTDSNYQKNLAAGETGIITPPASVLFANGIARYILSKPGTGNNGSVDMVVNALLAYLPSTTGRATFGVYRGNNEFIYLRENY